MSNSAAKRENVETIRNLPPKWYPALPTPERVRLLLDYCVQLEASNRNLRDRLQDEVSRGDAAEILVESMMQGEEDMDTRIMQDDDMNRLMDSYY